MQVGGFDSLFFDVWFEVFRNRSWMELMKSLMFDVRGSRFEVQCLMFDV